MKLISGRLTAYVLLVLLAPLFFSCEKDPDSIGLEVTPVQDQLFVNVIDTFTVQACSYLEDSAITSYTSLNLVGSQHDPVFGKTTCGFYTQVLLSSVNPDFGTNPVLDSLVLMLAYNGYYGDTNTLMTLKVYELEGNLYTDSTYYSNRVIPNTGIEYARMNFYPHPTDSVLVDTTMVAPFLRINLSRSHRDLGTKILTSATANLATNEAFVTYLKGLYITASPVSYSGAILYFNLLSSNTKMRLYYHDAGNDSLFYDLVINENCLRFNHFDHYGYSYANQAFRQQVIYKDSALGNDLLYVQGMAGVKVKLKFPTLKNWVKNQKIAINEAQLILPAYESTIELTPPSSLLAAKIEEDGTLSNLPDEAGGTSYFGGSYLSGTKEYRFRVTQYIQNILKESYVDYGMLLKPAGASVRANRILLAGPRHSARPLRLRVVYSYIH
ncbi:MAG: DUF4270 domain-containing protein [Bacteroidetes bacterium]|nr:DUF4270 domain-containing protein [Bacteroidota bacterium]